MDIWLYIICCCCSVVKLCLTLCNPMKCSMPGFPVLHYIPKLAQTHVYWTGDTIQPSHSLSPLLLLPPIFPSIRVILNESALCIRWPKYWSFSFSISPFNEYSELISFRLLNEFYVAIRFVYITYEIQFINSNIWSTH